MTPELNMTERRRHERFPLMLEAAVTIGGESFAAVIFDISGDGAKVRLMEAGNAAENAMPKTVVLNIPKYGVYEGDIIWTDDDYIGIHFHENHKTMVKLITGQGALPAA